MKKPLSVTYIDNCSHGYYSVSKKAIREMGISDKITRYSGMTYTRVYLEEDCDATLFFNKVKELGIDVVSKSSYQPNFAIRHNYMPEMFDYSPSLGDRINLCNDESATVTKVLPNMIYVTTDSGANYRISNSNPFRYIVGRVQPEVVTEPKDENQLELAF